MFASIIRKIRDAAGVFAKASQGKIGETEAVMWQHKLLELADSLEYKSAPQVSPHIPGDTEYEVYDWSKVSQGTLVTRSDHWLEHSHYKGRKTGGYYGILTGYSYYQDGLGRLITWPHIQWENDLSGSSNHPVNVVPLRTAVAKACPKIKMDDGQWGTNGPDPAALTNTGAQ